jgi:threonine aldolase
VKTNFVFFELDENARLSSGELCERLWADTVFAFARIGQPNRFRCVTHYWITRERVQQVIEAMRTLLS